MKDLDTPPFFKVRTGPVESQRQIASDQVANTGAVVLCEGLFDEQDGKVELLKPNLNGFAVVQFQLADWRVAAAFRIISDKRNLAVFLDGHH